MRKKLKKIERKIRKLVDWIWPPVDFDLTKEEPVLEDKLVEAVMNRVFNADKVNFKEISASTQEVLDRLTDMYMYMLETLTKKQQERILKRSERLLRGSDNV